MSRQILYDCRTEFLQSIQTTNCIQVRQCYVSPIFKESPFSQNETEKIHQVVSYWTSKLFFEIFESSYVIFNKVNIHFFFFFFKKTLNYFETFQILPNPKRLKVRVERKKKLKLGRPKSNVLSNIVLKYLLFTWEVKSFVRESFNQRDFFKILKKGFLMI